ncbi:30S ribosomal protein S4e [archaeon]|nr:30S ribosomal protein S4e [archaeon]|tara:strand:+ start:193 stop:882 length:690 start_codon:yes stop_codon:yes gene_type:complete
MAHLSRLAAPKSWTLKRKEEIWIVRSVPGPHALKKSIPLNLVIKGLLNYAETTRDVKKILNSGKILVDKKTVKDHHFPIGVMDIIEIPDTKESFIVLFDELGKFTLKKTKNSNVKYCKILNKKILKNKKIQLNLDGGRNILVKKDEYKVGDTALLDLTKKEITSSLKLEKNALIYLFAGKHVGNVGVLDSIKKSSNGPSRIILKVKDKKYETLKNYLIVVDKKFENEFV